MTVEIILKKETIKIDIEQGCLKDILDSLETILKLYQYNIKDAIDGKIMVNFK